MQTFPIRQNKSAPSKLTTAGTAIFLGITTLASVPTRIKLVDVVAPIGIYTVEATSSTAAFYITESVSDTLPPHHPAWKTVEQLFNKANATDDVDSDISYEWLREMRAHEDEHLSRLYESLEGE